MIELTKYETQWIKLIKGHDQDKYPLTGYWHNTLKPLFVEIYGWDPDEDNYHGYLQCVFGELLEIYLKIQDDQSGSNKQLMDLFNAAFYKGISNDSELPIERTIHILCGLIRFNFVTYKDKPR